MLLLDILFRYPTATLMLMLAVLVFRDGGKTQSSKFAALLSISAAALLLGTAPKELWLPWPLHVTVRLVDSICVPMVWWFARSLFEDDFTLGWIEWTGMIALSGITLVYRFQDLGYVIGIPTIFEFIMLIISLLMMVHLFYITIVGRHDDVIEKRRAARSYFVLCLILVTVTITITDRVFYDSFPFFMSTLRAVLILPVIVWGTLWLTRFHPETIAFVQFKTTAPQPAIDPRDTLLHQQLVEEMVSKQAYTEPGLTIRTLAERLETPEHRLRALINQGLGYRNFSGFVNFYRIEAVKKAMKDPENARTPVLTLAMNVGFNSLAPFNRAFLANSNQTPTEYRSNLFAKADHS